MNNYFYNRLQIKRTAAVLTLAPLAAGIGMARAQTSIQHDANGNRTVQTTSISAEAPQIIVPPVHQTGRLSGSAQFSVLASGPGPFTYVWLKDGVPIAGALSDSLMLNNLTAADFAASPDNPPKYQVQVTNAHGSQVSAAVGLYVDSTGFGLPDWWRQLHFGSLAPVNPQSDADGDGVGNLQEFVDGTSPADASSRLARVTLTGPAGQVTRFPDRDTYLPGTTVTLSGGSAGELQFGGWTGTVRGVSDLSFKLPGVGGASGDAVLKGLFGSMPVQKNAAMAPSFTYANNGPASVAGLIGAPDGGWLAWGSFDRVNGQTRVAVARFAADGSLDAGFNPAPDNVITGAALLPDGRVMLSGLFTQIGGQPRDGIARFLPDGTLDAGFTSSAAGGSSTVISMEVQRDGKVLLGGAVWDGVASRFLLRRNADGSPDSTMGTIVDNPPTVIRQQADGRILMGGDFTTVNGTPVPRLVRLNLDGTLDSSFNLAAASGAVTSVPQRILVQPDGRILVGGSVQVRLNGNLVTLPLVRLNGDGTLDSAFTQKVQAAVGNIVFKDMALQDDGRITGAGAFSLTNPPVVNVVRFKPDGTVDPDAFLISRPNAPVLAVAAAWDGSLLFGGSFSDVAVSTVPPTGKQYFLTPGRAPWSLSELHSQKLGGHLAAVNSVQEQDFLSKTFLPLTPAAALPVWIGYTDPVESLFHWTSGDPVTYINWHPNEPNNHNGDEDATVFNFFPQASPATWVDTPDAEASNGPCHGIIEIDPDAAPPTVNHWVAGRDLATNERAGAGQESSNPNASVPQWSYGVRAGLTSPVNTLNFFIASEHVNRPAEWDGWRKEAFATVAAVTRVDGCPAPSGRIRQSEMLLHPPPEGYSVVRWTAPAAGTYNISAFWQDVDWNGGDGCQTAIVRNGLEVLFNSEFDNGNGAFNSQIKELASGDTLDFMIGTRANDLADSARFNATVTRVADGAPDLWSAGRDLAVNEKPDAAAQETTNPNVTRPQWSYGHKLALISNSINFFQGAANHRNSFSGGPDDGMEGWASADAAVAVNTGNTSIAYNYGFGPNIPFNPEDMVISPGSSSGPYPVVRWTAPEAGRYEVFACWQDSDFHGGNGFSAHLLVNGAQAYGQDMDNAHGCSVAQSLDLREGDQVDFTMGTRGEYSFDTTKFNAVVVRPSSSTVPTVPTGTLTQLNSRSQFSQDAAVIDWSGAAPNNSDVAGNPFAIVSSTGHPFHVRKSTPGAFRRLVQGAGWSGNFAPGDAVLNHGYSDGPVIIEAAEKASAFSAIGFQIMPNQDGPFTATLRAYNRNGTLLGTFTANGTGNNLADNSAVFLGVRSSVANIHAISVDTDTAGFGGDFAINQISVEGPGNPFSNLRRNFARLVPTNHVMPQTLGVAPAGPIFAANAPASLTLPVQVEGPPLTYGTLEYSPDGMNFRPISYSQAAGGNELNFHLTSLPPGANYFRAAATNTQHETARSHAVGPLITPPVVTSLLTVSGDTGVPFTYTGTATGKLTGFSASALPPWAAAVFDINANTISISGTPPAGGTGTIFLQPANEAGSTTATLTYNFTTPFSTWKTAHFTASELLDPAVSGPLGDATGAGIPNLIKYALGIPPKQPGRAGMPTGGLQEQGENHYLTLVYTRDKSVQNVSITVEVSSDLEHWNSGASHTTVLSRVSNPNNTETITVRDNTPRSPVNDTRYIRLNVTQ